MLGYRFELDEGLLSGPLVSFLLPSVQFTIGAHTVIICACWFGYSAHVRIRAIDSRLLTSSSLPCLHTYASCIAFITTTFGFDFLGSFLISALQEALIRSLFVFVFTNSVRLFLHLLGMISILLCDAIDYCTYLSES